MTPNKTGQARARRLFPALGTCERCPAPARERHHISGDTLDNRRENVAFLCRRCHREVDGRLAAFVAAGNLASVVAHRARTTCVRGHQFTPENTYVTARGTRECRLCRARARRDYKRRKRNERARIAVQP